LSLDAADAADGTGLRGCLIDILSLLSTAGTSRALLHAAGRAGLAPEPGGGLSPATPQQVDAALGQLVSASLLAFNVDGSTISAHRLVMRVARERRAHDGTLAAIGDQVIDLLSAVTGALERPDQNRPATREAVQQIIALHEHLAAQPGDEVVALERDLLALRARALRCIHELGDSAAQAIEYGEPIVADSERLLGDAHPTTLASRNNLAYALQAAGRPDEAIPLFERTLTDGQQVLADGHPDTLTSRNNLAYAYQAVGRLDEAVPFFERTLTESEQALGAAHPKTLISRTNLAAAYQASGRLDEAIPLYERTLADRERVLGDAHPDTLASRDKLAVCRAARRSGKEGRQL
jgi:tetratricopeptide (TPR) repeat protein